jgi:hypothetical protein
MKKIEKVIAILLLVLAVSCSNDNDKIVLKGTKWKLAGIVDTEANTLKELEPKNCTKCYTFTFGGDGVFNPTIWRSNGEMYIGTGWYEIATGHACSNVMTFLYRVDYKTGAFFVYNVGTITEMGEPLDVKLYFESLELVQSFSYNENELKLFYNDNNNYLLFKSQK